MSEIGGLLPIALGDRRVDTALDSWIMGLGAGKQIIGRDAFLISLRKAVDAKQNDCSD
jgi:hypothetical protein